MDAIPMVDLQVLHAPLARDLEQAIGRVLGSGRFILGEEVAAFERELAQACRLARAVGLSSGTDALLALLSAAGVGPGDEVVTTPYSFFATAEAIVRLGARPVFADVRPDTLNLDAAAALSKLGPRTKAVLVVHLFGRVAPIDPLREPCRRAGVALFEDAAQAIAAGGVGSSDGAALSFFPSKNLGGVGDGGAILTDDLKLAEAIRALRVHGAPEQGAHTRVGGNFRLDELQAAVLRVKLPRLPAWTAARRRCALRYHAALAGLPIELPPLPPLEDGCVWNQFVIRVPAGARAKLREHLAAAGIATAVYYPVPLHLQPALAHLGYGAGSFPVAEAAAAETLALPIGPTLADGQIDRIASAAANVFSAG
jgi:dTDP-4-amino-4,6-dideoxygalactose transaminase